MGNIHIVVETYATAHGYGERTSPPDPQCHAHSCVEYNPVHQANRVPFIGHTERFSSSPFQAPRPCTHRKSMSDACTLLRRRVECSATDSRLICVDGNQPYVVCTDAENALPRRRRKTSRRVQEEMARLFTTATAYISLLHVWARKTVLGIETR